MKKLFRTVLSGMGLYTWAIDAENRIITLFKKSERKKFYGQFIKSGGLVFDVGANRGNRTSIFLELGAKVVAVEPQKECYEYLTKKFGDKIELVKLGLGGKESVETMYVSDTTLISSFSKNHVDEMQKDRFKGADWGKTVEVKMTTLDALIDKYGVPDFCKIDVEGYEFEVLKGLTKPLRSLSIEYIVPENKDVVLNCIKHLAGLGKVSCNLSHGESMDFHLDKWKSGEEMVEYVQGQSFIDTSYGDIYIRFD